MRVPCDLDPLAPEGSHETSVECLFSEVLLSLPTLDVFDLFLEEEPTKGVGTARIAADGVPLTEGTMVPKTTSIGTSKAAPGKVHATKANGTSSACRSRGSSFCSR